MSRNQTVTIDQSGRLVVPKALRDELGVTAGQPLDAVVCDGRLEIVPKPLSTDLVDRDGILVLVPDEDVEPLTPDDVRRVIESVRR